LRWGLKANKIFGYEGKWAGALKVYHTVFEVENCNKPNGKETPFPGL